MQPKGSSSRNFSCRRQVTTARQQQHFFICAFGTSGVATMGWCPHSKLCCGPPQQLLVQPLQHESYVKKMTIWPPSSSSCSPSRPKLGGWQSSRNQITECIQFGLLQMKNHQQTVAAWKACNLQPCKYFHIFSHQTGACMSSPTNWNIWSKFVLLLLLSWPGWASFAHGMPFQGLSKLEGFNAWAWVSNSKK